MTDETTHGPIRRSDTIGKLATALAKAQGELRNVARDQTAKVETRTGGSYEYTYTELSTVIDGIRGVMAANGLAYYQAPSADGQDVTVTTVLAHQSGEYFESGLTLRAKDASPQSVGSAITYARRYALLAAVGLAPEDDDGRAAQGHDRPAQAALAAENATGRLKIRKEEAPPRHGRLPQPASTINAQQAARMFTIAKKAGQDLDELRAYFAGRGWKSTTDMPVAAYDEVCQRIEAGTVPAPKPPADDFSSAKEIGEAAFPGAQAILWSSRIGGD